MRKNNLAYREEFFAGRLGIRAKILIYLAILAGFIISTVWMLQGVMFLNVRRGRGADQADRPVYVVQDDGETGEDANGELPETVIADRQVAVIRLEDGTLRGSADPRRDGYALGY